MLPINKEDILGYGYRLGDDTKYNDFHLGLDIVAKKMTRIFDREPLDIIDTYWGTEGGNSTIAHSARNHVYLRLLHQERIDTQIGQKTQGNTVLGVVGNTGKVPHFNTMVPHVHLEVINDKATLFEVKTGSAPKKYYIDPFIYYKNLLPINDEDMPKYKQFWLCVDKKAESKGIKKDYVVVISDKETAYWVSPGYEDSFDKMHFVPDVNKVGGEHLWKKAIAGKKLASFREVAYKLTKV